MTLSIDNGLFVFGIPLVPKHRSKNWPRVLENLQATLQSVLNQTNENFQVLIAAEDDIDLPEVRDDRVRVLRTIGPEAEQPGYLMKNGDATNKRVLLCNHAKRLKAHHIFLVDADDLISKNVVEFVKCNPHPHGYAITRGLVFDCASGKLLPCPSNLINVDGFDTYCGSSLIYNLKRSEGPPYDNWPIPVVQLGHNKVRKAMLESGHPLLQIEVPLVAYVLNSGENITMQEATDNPYLAFADYVTNAISTHGRPMSRQELDEFGLLFGR